MSYTDHDFPHTHMYESDLRELIHKVTRMYKQVNELEAWKNTHEKEYEQLKELYDQIVSGNFPPEVEAAFYKWASENMVDIIGTIITTKIFFKLTDDGYFTAYIPESWSQIQFNTTQYDIWLEQQPEFGHLVLSY